MHALRIAQTDIRRGWWLLLAGVVLLALAARAGAEETIVGIEHRVSSVSAYDGKSLSLEVWEKYRRDLDPKVFTTTGKVVLLAHGAGNSGRVVFDVQVPGATGLTYSLMDYLAEQGFDVFTLAYPYPGLAGRGASVPLGLVMGDVHRRAVRHPETPYRAAPHPLCALSKTEDRAQTSHHRIPREHGQAVPGRL